MMKLGRKYSCDKSYGAETLLMSLRKSVIFCLALGVSDKLCK